MNHLYLLDYNYIVVPFPSGFFWVHVFMWKVCKNSSHSPQLGLGGSHHLPPYNILCGSPRHLHSNDFLSWDSQGGVSKLSRFGLSPLYGVITLCSNLQLGWGLKQTWIFCWELSNVVSHSPYTHWGWVDSQLLVVGSRTASLTLGLSFCHNLCCRCLNGSCKPIFDIYTLIIFQWYKESFNARCVDPYNQTLKFRESRRTPKSPFWECESHPLTLPKVGLRHLRNLTFF